MSDPAERIAVRCPSCSPDVETVHEVLKPGGQTTVRCTECDHVHKTKIETPETAKKDVVVSQDGESFTATVDVPVDETIAAGEEFVLETEAAIMVVRITSLERDDGRVEESRAGDVQTIWTRAVDNVTVNATVHPKDGRHDETRSVQISVPGDYEFVVDDVEEFGDEEFVVEGIQIRDDAPKYRFDKLDHEGDMAIAKDVKRLYGRDTKKTAWSAW